MFRTNLFCIKLCTKQHIIVVVVNIVFMCPYLPTQFCTITVRSHLRLTPVLWSSSVSSQQHTPINTL